MFCDGLSNPWEHVGPAGYSVIGDTGRIEGIPSAGAAQAAVNVNGTEWLVGTANGGIWKTANVLAKPGPHWSQVLDTQPVSCTSISAMANLENVVSLLTLAPPEPAVRSGVRLHRSTVK